MTARERFERLARAAAGRPFLTLGVVVALAIGGGLLALGLRPDASSSTFVSSSSSSYRATNDDHRHFGADAVVVLVREKLTNLVETKDLGTLSQLEACLGGQVLNANQQLESFTPAKPGSKPPYGGYDSPCGKLMKTKPVQVVYGPGTFLNRAVSAVRGEVLALVNGAQTAVTSAEQAAYKLAIGKGLSRAQAQKLAKAAGTLKQQQESENLAQLYLNSGISGIPSIDNVQFISQVVFDQTRGVNQPKARFSYLFPTANSALIQVRLNAGLTDSQQRNAIKWIREAVQMPMFHLGYGGTYTVSGVPVVTNDLASEITGSIAGLLVAAVLVMAAMLLIVFRSRLRLLPLAVALAAVGITFGIMSLLGASLTMASIAVLPILIGLAVDYAIQFQSRVQEVRRESSETGLGVADAVARAAGEGAPTIATAALATATGFLVLLLSPVPMVRGFGLLLVVGIAVALACALTAGSAALVVTDRSGGVLGASLRGAAEILRGAGAVLRSAGKAVGAALRGAGALPASLVPGRLRRRHDTGALRPQRSAGTRILAGSVARPQRVLAVGLVLAGLGWLADTQTSVQSDVTKLVPSNMPALRDLRTLENVTGVSGEIDVTVHANNVATPTVIGWMIQYENALLTHFGYLEAKGCGKATLCPALSLPDLFSTGGNTKPPSASDINTLLKAVPAYFSQAVITPDHREAALAFGIRLMPLSRQERVIDYMRSQLHPPAGVTAQLAGVPVLAADANAALSSSARRLLTLLAGLAAVGLALLMVFRRPRRVVVPLIPIALATGWSALILFLIGIPLNPMSATLGTLVIAISTEFSVLLSERFRQERVAGHELSEALLRTYRSTGRAVLASGITAIAGFGVLIFSNITMLRDFGFVTLIDLSVSLAGVLLLLPAVLALSERDGLLEAAGGSVRQAIAALPRPGRRARVA
jgi:uncharacterized protein